MRSRGYFPFLVLSLAFHVVLLLFFASGLLARLALRKPVPPQEAPVLQLLQQPPPQGPEFIPTAPDQTVPVANPKAPYESENNTQLKSEEKGDKKNDLPQQKGDPHSDLNYQQTPASPRQDHPASKPQPPQPEVKPSETEPQPEAPNPVKPQPVSPDGFPMLPDPNNSSQKETKPDEKPSKKTDPTKESPPPSPASFARPRSQIDGDDSPQMGATSPESKQTEIGRYKAKMYRAIGSLWYLKVDRQMTLLAIGALKVRFYVQSNGVIRDVEVTDRSGRTDILETVSKQSIIEAGPFEPFSDAMKQQLGDGYEEEITFSIY